MPTLDSNSPQVAHLTQRDWRLGRLIQAVGPLTYSVEGSAYEHLAYSVIEQMLSMKAGRTINARLADACGGHITQEAILSLGMDDIRTCGMAQRKAQTLIELARSMPEARLAQLQDLPDEEVRSALTQVRGIGKWTADMYLIFYLCRPDVLPVEDGAIRQVFKWLYGAPITDANVRQVVCSLWRPFSSTAVRYMYRALNRGIVAQGPAADALGL
ncbi:MAG: DNA-3-methyladenine glycosylase family protein [Atopobiaceae bacterium]